VNPKTEELERTLGDDVAWASSELGSEIAEVTAVSPLRGSDRPRAAFRLTLADGRKLKLRRMRSPERAAELARLVGQLRDLGIPQVVLRRAETLIVDWIDGTPLCEGPDRPERIEEAARLLGRIHATPTFDGLGLPVVRPTAPQWLAMQEEITALVRARKLAAEIAKRLSAAAQEHDPGPTRHGIVHGDFCAENFVSDGAGCLRVVDNEGLEVGPLALDLARVWSRWPMSESAWGRFLVNYPASGGDRVVDADLLVWKIRTLVRSAWYRVTYRLAGTRKTKETPRFRNGVLVALAECVVVIQAAVLAEFAGAKESLEDQCRGDLIDDLSALGAAREES
jgi:aminoglycoside phosphotransferase (APT) family kinase protein